MNTYGCAIIFADYMEVLTGWMSGMALLLIVLQVIQYPCMCLDFKFFTFFWWFLIDFSHRCGDNVPKKHFTRRETDER